MLRDANKFNPKSNDACASWYMTTHKNNDDMALKYIYTMNWKINKIWNVSYSWKNDAKKKKGCCVTMQCIENLYLILISNICILFIIMNVTFM